MERWAALIALGRRQHNVVGVEQAAACGISQRTLWRRADAEGWERPFPAVFALPGSAATHERLVSAALLAVGGEVAASRLSAAYLSGMIDRPPALVDLALPPGRRTPQLDGVRALRSKTLNWADLTRARALRATIPERTICDLSSVTRLDELRGMVLDGRQRRVLDLARLRRRHAELGRFPGAARLARILEELAAAQPDSVFEHEVRAFVRTRGLTHTRNHCGSPAETGGGARSISRSSTSESG